MKIAHKSSAQIGPISPDRIWLANGPEKCGWIGDAYAFKDGAAEVEYVRLDGWQPIATAPELDRIWVCGWSGPNALVRGYWWYHEDAVLDGVVIDHPDATHWCAIILPPFPENPNDQ